MSYLDSPRIHFTGFFQADVSTVNNDVRYFDVDAFQPEYQQLSLTGDGGSWHPNGTGIFRFVNCQITGASLDGRAIYAQSQDAVIGMSLQNADNRAPGKMVDLDPQQQAVSEIWGMGVRLTNGRHRALFSGDYVPAAFTNLWARQQTGVLMDQKLGACYGSILENVRWEGDADSPVLEELADLTEHGLLSIQFNVYGYGRDPTIPRYTMGHLSGTIGPYRSTEPRHFALGRQMAAQCSKSPTTPDQGVYSFACKVDTERQVVTADFGNCLQIVDANSGLADSGPLLLGILKHNPSTLLDTVHVNDFVSLGKVPYQQTGWYPQTAGVQEFPYAGIEGAADIVDDHALVLLRGHIADDFDVVVQESLDGVYVRADNFVLRIEPGEATGIDFYASRYGHPLIGAQIATSVYNDSMGGTGAGDAPLDPPVATPEIGIPADGISYPATFETSANGKARMPITAKASGPGVPRGYIQNQLYGIGYQLVDQPPGYAVNLWNFISVMAYSHCAMPAQPTWYDDIETIFEQFGNLYPIMSKHLVDLSSYASCVEHRKILRLAFALPRADPNHMPVTRDMSTSMRDMVLRWLDGLPDGTLALGTPAASPRVTARPMSAAVHAPVALEPLQTAGKTAFLLETQMRRALRGRKP